MIHRESRDRIAAALRHYVAGRITNDDLDDELYADWRDRGAVAVSEMAWMLYDDTVKHRATGRHYLDKRDRREIARWIAFLYSDEEYLWPEYSFIEDGKRNGLMTWLTFGWWKNMKRQIWEEFLEAGDFSVWPFCSREQLERVLPKPRLLSGHQT